MSIGLTPVERGLLRLSVGYGTHKKGRPLSPIEVGVLVDRLGKAGMSLEDRARYLMISETATSRFLRILELPEDLQHLVGWGVGEGTISFSCAVELRRLKDLKDQRLVGESILTDNINSREVRAVVQLRMRSGKTIDDCISEVLKMRPVVEKRYLFIGSIVDGDVVSRLDALTQMERNAVLMSGVDLLGLGAVAGRLGRRFFSLAGDEAFDASIKSIGEDSIETTLRAHIREKLGNARSQG